MTHLAVQEHQDGNAVDWLEQVSDVQYLPAPAQAAAGTAAQPSRAEAPKD